MSAPTTAAAAQAAYLANADYDEANSVAKARAFVVACRVAILFVAKSMPVAGASSGGAMQLNPDLIQKKEERALEWLAAHDLTAGGSVGGVTYGPGGPAVVTLGLQR